MTTTWGELRTLNSDRLIEAMCKIPKGNRIIFKMSANPESTEWVIIPKVDYDQIIFDREKIKKLEMKLIAVVNIASL